MRKCFLAAIVLVAVVAWSQEIAMEKIADDVLVLTGGGGNITAINSDKGILVVDSFISPKAAQQARDLIEKQFPGKKIRYLVNTHFNLDHTFGNQVFRDTEIIGHINNSKWWGFYDELIDRVRASGDRVKELEAKLNSVEQGTQEAEKIKRELEEWKQNQENYKDFVLTKANLDLDGNLDLRLGNKTIRILHFGPGHTDGDLVLLAEEDRVLIMGDLLFCHSVPYIHSHAGADVLNWVKSLDKLLQMSEKYDIVVPGHGGVGTKQILEEQKSYLLDLWQAVVTAFKSGVSLDQAKAEIKLEKYKDYDRYNSLDTNIEACWRILER